MNKSISTRQIILILLVSLLSLKVLYLPSLLASNIGRNSFVYVFIFLIFDFLCLLIFLLLVNKNPNLTFNEMLEKMFGKFLTKVILFILMLFFLLKSFGIFQTNYSYLSENLYSSIKWYTCSFTIIVGVVFIISFGLNAIARLVEIFTPVIIIGFFISLIIGVVKSDYSNLLPIFEGGFLKKIPDLLKFSFWFGDYLIFPILFGNIKMNKRFNLKIVITIAVAVLLTTFFIATSYALFSYNSVTHTNSISDVLQVLPSTSDMGSFDWLLILIWDVCLFLSFTLSFWGAFYCFRQVFFKKLPLFTTLLLIIAILVPSIIINFDINTGINFVKDYASYFCLGVEVLLPILMLVFSFKIKGGSNKNV